jgi:hypothetical protein
MSLTTDTPNFLPLSSTTDATKFITIEEAIMRQTPTPDGWVCPKCKNYKGDLVCSMNVFIAFVGANTKNCIWKA